MAGSCGTNSARKTRSWISVCSGTKISCSPTSSSRLVFFSFAGINYLLPFYLKYVRNYDTSDAGLVLTSLSFAMMGAGILAGMLINRTGPRLLCIAAALPLTAGYFLMTRLHTDTHAGYVVISLVLIGFGLGLMITPLSNMIMNSVARTKQGMISSLTSLERFAPLTLGIATFNLIFLQGVLTIAKNHDVTRKFPRSDPGSGALCRL